MSWLPQIPHTIVNPCSLWTSIVSNLLWSPYSTLYSILFFLIPPWFYNFILFVRCVIFAPDLWFWSSSELSIGDCFAFFTWCTCPSWTLKLNVFPWQGGMKAYKCETNCLNFKKVGAFQVVSGRVGYRARGSMCTSQKQKIVGFLREIKSTLE